MTDPISNAVVAAYEYDGFGRLSQTQGILVQPFGFTGREYDTESALYYFRARYLDALQGDFLQSDPIGFDAGPVNIYEFSRNNPHNLQDPSGLTTREYIDDAISNKATSVTGSTYALTGITTLGGKLGGALQDLTFGYDLGFEWHDKQAKFVSTGNGYCSSSQKAALQAAVKAAEGTPKCVPYAGKKIAKNASAIRANRVQNLRPLRRHSKFAIAQSNINAICYAGGDEIHRAKVQDALKSMTFCRNAITLLRKNP